MVGEGRQDSKVKSPKGTKSDRATNTPEHSQEKNQAQRLDNKALCLNCLGHIGSRGRVRVTYRQHEEAGAARHKEKPSNKANSSQSLARLLVSLLREKIQVR